MYLFLWQLIITGKLRQHIVLGCCSPLSLGAWWTFASLMLEAVLQAVLAGCQPVHSLRFHFGSLLLPFSVLSNWFFLKAFCHLFHSENTFRFPSNSWSLCCSLFRLPPFSSQLFCQHLVCLLFLFLYLSRFHCSLPVEQWSIFPSGTHMTYLCFNDNCFLS